MQNQPGPGGADLGFAERLLEVIDSGRRTATCKLALRIACWTCAPGMVTQTGGLPG